MRRSSDAGPTDLVLAAVEAATARGRRWSTTLKLVQETELPRQEVEAALVELAEARRP
jgi:hypothetical protein